MKRPSQLGRLGYAGKREKKKASWAVREERKGKEKVRLGWATRKKRERKKKKR
jgi:hypothetical protein